MRLKIAAVFTLGLLTVLPAFAQVLAPAQEAAKELALEQALDHKSAKEDAHISKPNRPPDIAINCNNPYGPNNSINGVLARLDRTRVWTLAVSGACHENVVVQSFENLNLVAQPGASITDPSGGNLDVIDVFDTPEFSLQGFTINGGLTGVFCGDLSLCRFNGNTVQGSGDGVFIGRSRASLQGDILQNNAGRGLVSNNGSLVYTTAVTIQGNGAGGTPGAVVNAGSRLSGSLVSQNNGGSGIRVANHSILNLSDSALVGNGGPGVWAVGGSEAAFSDNLTFNLVTGNGGQGVRLGDLSFAAFAGADQITGNHLGDPFGLDVYCGPQFSATRGVFTNIGGGTTNCIEP